ncbi:MAG: methionine adenosyltransferase [Oscillospiraceae bacterium]|nr:methionine adenosyltransferase [Oscillospiraceae bacterium]
MKLFTSESVTEGHSDKVCDQISDGVLDAILAQDPHARVACESIVTTGMALVMGEISTNAYADIPKIVRDTLQRIGYDDAVGGMDYRTCAILTSIDEQSADIAQGVNQAFEYAGDAADMTGAGDQGMMFGYACDETPELMPAALVYSHKLTRQLTQVRKDGTFGWLRPDGKAQVTVQYDKNGNITRCPAIVLSAHHTENISTDALRKALREAVIDPVIPVGWLDNDTKFYINPTGRFVVGGPQGDSGLTGRKLIVDTYGGAARHGGGAFSGKDPTKVDRSAAYMMRHIAKNIVAAGLARRCELEVAYAIGVSTPVSVLVDTFGTGIVSDDKITAAINQLFDLRPAKIIEYLDLRRPIYAQTAAYGHFGRHDLDLPWEKTHRADELKELLA